uniref:Uncharacterized protein n=1 Tax=Cacopsylla melanoneura TaxID=428564 RepID=A0A8D8WCR6_9HEMI
MLKPSLQIVARCALLSIVRNRCKRSGSHRLDPVRDPIQAQVNAHLPRQRLRVRSIVRTPSPSPPQRRRTVGGRIRRTIDPTPALVGGPIRRTVDPTPARVLGTMVRESCRLSCDRRNRIIVDRIRTGVRGPYPRRRLKSET